MEKEYNAKVLQPLFYLKKHSNVYLLSLKLERGRGKIHEKSTSFSRFATALLQLSHEPRLKQHLLEGLNKICSIIGVSESPALEPALCIYKGHSNRVSALAWSPDSIFVASASHDGTVQVWQAATGRRRSTLANTITDVVAWSPDGTRIASGYARLIVWDAYEGERLCLKEEKVQALAWSPDSSYLVHLILSFFIGYSLCSKHS